MLLILFGLLIAACTTRPSPEPSFPPAPSPGPIRSPLPGLSPEVTAIPSPSPPDAVSLSCVFGPSHLDVCRQAAAVAEAALPADRPPVTAMQVSGSQTLSICHFGDPAWTPTPSSAEDGIGCTVIVDLTMDTGVVSMVLIYDYTNLEWRVHLIRQGPDAT